MITRLALGISLCAAAAVATAQDYPNKSIRFLVPFPTGGAPDFLARIMSAHLTETWRQPVVVDNRPGANGIVATEATARAPKDGYTIQMGSVATHGINPALYTGLTFDTVKDFAGITRIGYTPLIIAANPSVAAASVKDLIALARARPGALTYGSVGNGSAGHLAGELFTNTARIKLVHVPYKGIALATTDLIGGQISMTFGNPLNALPFIKSGKLRGLGVTSNRRMTALPDVAAISESLPGYEVILWWGVFAPAGTPQSTIQKLHGEIARALNAPGVKSKWDEQGTVIEPSTPEQLNTAVKFEVERWARIVKQAGIKLD